MARGAVSRDGRSGGGRDLLPRGVHRDVAGLMETLIAAAEAHGFRWIEGYVLSTNAAMRGLAKRLGFQESPFPGDATVRVVKRGLGA